MNVHANPASVDPAEIDVRDNTIPIEAWNSVLFDKFCRFRHLLTGGLAGHSEEFFRRKSYPAGARVLDVGCGFGETTRHIAAQVGSAGEAVGVDAAPKFIEAATNRDYPLLLGLLTLGAFLTILGNLIADMLYGVVDPRIRYS